MSLQQPYFKGLARDISTNKSCWGLFFGKSFKEEYQQYIKLLSLVKLINQEKLSRELPKWTAPINPDQDSSQLKVPFVPAKGKLVSQMIIVRARQHYLYNQYAQNKTSIDQSLITDLETAFELFANDKLKKGSVYFDTAAFDANPNHYYAKLEPNYYTAWKARVVVSSRKYVEPKKIGVTKPEKTGFFKLLSKRYLEGIRRRKDFLLKGCVNPP
ncbi:hypothetical protein CONCODRAFT_7356 [Conidiobolus coronatus NRRL 28638]|uniref:Uncharacterized protein n=1 Tax=Conidiobolus coronatus (strain ATCC 28846 / CBS 209.66 / NRRL 28638) TaxID=796925 RepID=A0A137P537_CONC2|nr:hypothetical protein CONCODRAFT_7356 [Conidiobolus coronatus NRRL 28638]|eukprot:KXN70118.1 hypothetical protein CONCODRAFT_7356 [Conidiobolus coronatus NRRL 28638]